jgi:tyrosyl-tRNA synthetase
MNVKFGIDPTGDKLHLGHFAVLRRLMKHQECGHKIHIILGTFTAMIGDPTGRDLTRPKMDFSEVSRNADAIEMEIRSIVPAKNLTIHRNHEWLNKIDPIGMVELLSLTTVQQILTKESFKNRISSGVPISLHEMVYPIFQGFDSVQIESDLELGGKDQMFNVMLGAKLQEKFGKKPQSFELIDILEGVGTTQKMSKTLNNQINVSDSSRTIFDKILNIRDNQIEHFRRLLTDLGAEDADPNPRNQKEVIAKNVLRQLGMTLDMDDFQVVDSREMDIVSCLISCGVSVSKSDARRKIEQGGVSVLRAGVFERVDSHHLVVQNGEVVKIGKKKFRIK